LSTRYVWSIYPVSIKDDRTTAIYARASHAEVFLCNSYQTTVIHGQNSASNGYLLVQYTPVGGITVSGIGGTDKSNPTSSYRYAILNGRYYHSSGSYVPKSSTLCEVISGQYWHAQFHSGLSNGDATIYINDSTDDFNSRERFYKSNGVLSKGSTISSYKTQASKNLEDGAFLENGTAWWREYLGSDTIDPTAVAYSKSDLQAGESVTIQVSPRTPTYGGTISYQYQYSTDGGSSWTNIGSKTTNTSVSVTIPDGAKQFKARVRASDNYGFTSSDYVTGPALGVSVLKAYVGINTKARAVSKIYVGVNGKAREVVKGYIGVGGKARKFL